MPAWWAPTARSASIPSSIAARPERPGLVLGLDRGGNCRGIAYRVAAAKRAATIDYLRAREQVTKVYREAWRAVWLDDDPQQSVHALCYMVDRGHRQYAGRLTLAQQLHYVRQGHGRSGACRDYVLAAVKELRSPRLSRRRLAPAGRAAQGHPRNRRGLSSHLDDGVWPNYHPTMFWSDLPGGIYASSAAACRDVSASSPSAASPSFADDEKRPRDLLLARQ